MTTTDMRATHSRNRRLHLAAWLAFVSWGAVAAYFVGVPLAYWLGGSLSWPLVAGAACLVLIIVVVQSIVAQAQTCRVCGAPVFGGSGHGKHPGARKFLGFSRSRQVAWEILTSPAYHCMHCFSVCQCRSGGDTVFGNAADSLPESVFLPPKKADLPPAAGPPVELVPAPAAAPSSFHAPVAFAPSAMVPLGPPTWPPLQAADIIPESAPPTIFQESRAPSPPSMISKAIPTAPNPTETMRPIDSSHDGLPAFPEDLPFSEMEHSQIESLPHRTTAPLMTAMSAAPTSLHPQPPVVVPGHWVGGEKTAAPPPRPASPADPAAAPRAGTSAAGLQQLVGAFAKALAETRQSVDGAFEKLLGEFKQSVAAFVQQPSGTPSGGMPATPVVTGRNGNSSQTHSAAAGAIQAPVAAPIPPSVNPSDLQRVAQFNAVLAQAFAQQHPQGVTPSPPLQAMEPAAPAHPAMPPRPFQHAEPAAFQPVFQASSQPGHFTASALRPSVAAGIPAQETFAAAAQQTPVPPAVPQSPFTLVTPMAAAPGNPPAAVPSPPPPPPAASPAVIAAAVQRAVPPPVAAAVPSSASPFAAVSALPEPSTAPQASPFQAIPSSHFNGAPFAAVSASQVAPFSFLTADGGTFVPDPVTAPGWLPAAAQQAAPVAPQELEPPPPWAQPFLT
ncbi:MAG: hypothetical protein KA004_06475 [Verrucomicrobiales bacterium]|nr:hypothetical protein [Verrucomicrobiales bacterium]